MAIGAVVARILTQYSDKGSKAAQKDIAKLGKKFDDFSRRTTKAFGLAAAAVGAFAIKIGKDAVQAALADQKSQALLANSLRNTTGATNAAIATVEDYISKLQLQVGVADDELRPALSKLAAVTGSVTAAQDLLGIALDVSAFSGADLGTATNAVTRALQGNFKGLQKLVPSLDATTLKSKNFAKIMEEVQRATQGAAASRANTLEYRLEIMRIRFGEVLETLGYALLPVIEKFADTLQKKVLPQIEKWIADNKQGLIDGLEKAANAAINLTVAALSFTQWILDHTGLVKTFAALIATIWATAKIYTFITALQGIAVAFGLITVSANGATTATLRFKAAAGFLLKWGKVLIGIGAVLGLSGSSATEGGYPVGTVGAQDAKKKKLMKAAEKPLGNYQMSTGTVLKNSTVSGTNDSLDAILKKLQAAQDKLNNSKKKELTTEQKIINAMLKKYGLTLMTSEIEAKATAEAIRQNLDKQKKMGISSPTVSLLASANTADQGTLGTKSGTPVVNVNITTPYGTKDDFIVDVNNELNTLQRRRGAGAGGGFFRTRAE
jgi:hypothetical protein